MSPQWPAIFLQHSRSAAVIAALGTTHAITGNAANNTARAKTATFCTSFNVISVAASVSWTQPEAKSYRLRRLRDLQPNLHRGVVTSVQSQFSDSLRQNSRYKDGTTNGCAFAFLAVPYRALQSDRCLVITTWSSLTAPFHGANAGSNPAGDANSIT